MTVGEGPMRGLQIGSGFTVPVRVLYAEMFLRIGKQLRRAFLWAGDVNLNAGNGLRRGLLF